MRLGPKALVGLGLPAALRPHTPDKGGGLPSLPTGYAFVVIDIFYLVNDQGDFYVLEA